MSAKLETTSDNRLRISGIPLGWTSAMKMVGAVTNPPLLTSRQELAEFRGATGPSP